MTGLTYEQGIQLLLAALEGYRGNKSAQAIYLQEFIQQFGPVAEEYGSKVRKLME